MPLRVKVKVGDITNLSEARYCAGMGVDLLGFPVTGEKLTPEQYKQIIEWVSGPEFVLEAQDSPADELEKITSRFPGHYIQIGKNQLSWLADASLNFIVSIDSAEWVTIEKHLIGKTNIRYIELSGATDVVAIIQRHFPVLLAVDAGTDINSILREKAAGIAMKGSDELKPGLKDYGHLSDILEALETE